MPDNGAGIAEEAIGILYPLDRIESRFRTMVVMVVNAASNFPRSAEVKFPSYAGVDDRTG